MEFDFYFVTPNGSCSMNRVYAVAECSDWREEKNHKKLTTKATK